MAHTPHKYNCQNCKRIFYPDHRNVTRQRFCSKPECRHASKVDSQQRWRQKPDNLDYFKGEAHVERVRQWRRAHPGYWRRKAPEVSSEPDALQETLMAQEIATQPLRAEVETAVQDALQDSFFLQPAVFVGLIAQLSGLALQDDIAEVARRLQQLGRDILDCSPHVTGGSADAHTPDLFGQAAPRPAAMQLGGSARGP